MTSRIKLVRAIARPIASFLIIRENRRSFIENIVIMLSRKRTGTPVNNKRACKCIKHAFLTHETQQKRLHNVSAKDYPKKALEYLKSHHLFGPESKYICDVCIK